MIRVIVGLGNPGRDYEKTRHNAGFIFLDHLAESEGVKWSHAGQFSAEIADIVVGHEKLILLKPMTFMNKSGISVGRLLSYYKFKPEEMLVVHDELELSECVVRIKSGGGHAGHNGLRDIIAHIGTNDFLRLRMGIGRPDSGANIADYVLSKPSNQVLRDFEDICASIVRKLDCLVMGDFEAININP